MFDKIVKKYTKHSKICIFFKTDDTATEPEANTSKTDIKETISEADSKTSGIKAFLNYNFLFSIISGILLIVVQVLAEFKIAFNSEIVLNITSIVLSGLVVLGVITGPLKKKEISDDDNNDEDNNEDSNDKNEKDISID